MKDFKKYTIINDEDTKWIVITDKNIEKDSKWLGFRELLKTEDLPQRVTQDIIRNYPTYIIVDNQNDTYARDLYQRVISQDIALCVQYAKTYIIKKGKEKKFENAMNECGAGYNNTGDSQVFLNKPISWWYTSWPITSRKIQSSPDYHNYDYEYQDKHEEDIDSLLQTCGATLSRADPMIINDLDNWIKENKDFFRGTDIVNPWKHIDISNCNDENITSIFEGYTDGYYLPLLWSGNDSFETEIYLPNANCKGTIKMLYNLPNTGKSDKKILWFIPNLLSNETKEISHIKNNVQQEYLSRRTKTIKSSLNHDEWEIIYNEGYNDFNKGYSLDINYYKDDVDKRDAYITGYNAAHQDAKEQADYERGYRITDDEDIWLPPIIDSSRRNNMIESSYSPKKITAKSKEEFYNEIENLGYEIFEDDGKWLTLENFPNVYEAEYTRYSDGDYELMLYNIHKTGTKIESSKQIKSSKSQEEFEELVIDIENRLGVNVEHSNIFNLPVELTYEDECYIDDICREQNCKFVPVNGSRRQYRLIQSSRRNNMIKSSLPAWAKSLSDDDAERRNQLQELYNEAHWEFLYYIMPCDPEWTPDMADGDFNPLSEVHFLFENAQEIESFLANCDYAGIPGAEEKLKRIRQINTWNEAYASGPHPKAWEDWSSVKSSRQIKSSISEYRVGDKVILKAEGDSATRTVTEIIDPECQLQVGDSVNDFSNNMDYLNDAYNGGRFVIVSSKHIKSSTVPRTTKELADWVDKHTGWDVNYDEKADIFTSGPEDAQTYIDRKGRVITDGPGWTESHTVEEFMNMMDEKPIQSALDTVKVTFDNGDTIVTDYNADVGREEIAKYYMHNYFNVGGEDEMHQVVKVEFPGNINSARTPEVVDMQDAEDLALFAENDHELYDMIIKPTFDNLQRKLKRGIYDKNKALIAWEHVIDEAAKAYDRQLGSKRGTMTMFNKATRKEAAKILMDSIWDEDEWQA